jgi:hypothetical protein
MMRTCAPAGDAQHITVATVAIKKALAAFDFQFNSDPRFITFILCTFIVRTSDQRQRSSILIPRRSPVLYRELSSLDICLTFQPWGLCGNERTSTPPRAAVHFSEPDRVILGNLLSSPVLAVYTVALGRMPPDNTPEQPSPWAWAGETVRVRELADGAGYMLTETTLNP